MAEPIFTITVQKEKPTGRYFTAIQTNWYKATPDYFELYPELVEYLQNQGLARVYEVEDAGFARTVAKPIESSGELVAIIREYEESIPAGYAHPDFSSWYQIPEIPKKEVAPPKEVEIPEFRPRRPDESMEEYLKAKAEWEKEVKGYTEIKLEELAEPVVETEKISYETYAVLTGEEEEQAKEPIEDLEKEISENSGFIEYHIVKGDTLSSIASRFGTTWQEIWKYNSWIKDPNVIYPCWTIKVPKRVEGFSDTQEELQKEIDKVGDECEDWESLFNKDWAKYYQEGEGATDAVCRASADDFYQVDKELEEKFKQILELSKEELEKLVGVTMSEAQYQMLQSEAEYGLKYIQLEREALARNDQALADYYHNLAERSAEVFEEFDAFINEAIWGTPEQRNAIFSLFGGFFSPLEKFGGLFLGSFKDFYLPTDRSVETWAKDFEKWLEELGKEETQRFSKKLEGLS